jgi:hypothetical protein
MESRLQDVLHLVAYNGFAKDIGPAALCCKETLEDERIWFPHLIQQTYGPKAKTRPQILAEHMLCMKGQATKFKVEKNGLYVFRHETRWLERMAYLENLARKAEHTGIFESILGTPDLDGNSTFITACKNDCPGIVSYYLNRGVDYNQKNDRGATPAYYALHSEYGSKAYCMLPQSSICNAPQPKPREELMWINNFEYIPMNMITVEDIQMWFHKLQINVINQSEPVKPKKIKSKLYKQRFGPKRYA